MTFQAEPPRLPKWIFLVGDAALLATAGFIASHSAHPTNGPSLIAIVTCVALAAICGAIPFVADYARSQDEAVDERRRALEGMARTVASSAEQVAITANGLHQIAELAQKNLKQAEQLTQHLQERIAELQAQVADVRESDKEEIARMESASDKIAKAVGDSAKIETAVRKALAAAVAEFETKATAAATSAAQRAGAALDSAGAALAARIETAASAPLPSAPTPEAATPAPPLAPSSETIPAAPILVTPTAIEPALPPSQELPAPRKRSPKKTPAPEPVPSLELIPEIPSEVPPADSPSPAPEVPSASAADPAFTPTSSTPASVRVQTSDSPSFPVHEPEPAAQGPGDEFPEPAVSSDGATRILVTAYIGIGNRLFIRGDGPGLNWEKGMPLQFVSIGKWRWETSDAAASVKFKLYKNDELECSAVGEQTVDPGSQRELNATF